MIRFLRRVKAVSFCLAQGSNLGKAMDNVHYLLLSLGYEWIIVFCDCGDSSKHGTVFVHTSKAPDGHDEEHEGI